MLEYAKKGGVYVPIKNQNPLEAGLRLRAIQLHTGDGGAQTTFATANGSQS